LTLACGPCGPPSESRAAPASSRQPPPPACHASTGRTQPRAPARPKPRAAAAAHLCLEAVPLGHQPLIKVSHTRQPRHVQLRASWRRRRCGACYFPTSRMAARRQGRHRGGGGRGVAQRSTAERGASRAIPTTLARRGAEDPAHQLLLKEVYERHRNAHEASSLCRGQQRPTTEIRAPCHAARAWAANSPHRRALRGPTARPWLACASVPGLCWAPGQGPESREDRWGAAVVNGRMSEKDLTITCPFVAAKGKGPSGAMARRPEAKAAHARQARSFLAVGRGMQGRLDPGPVPPHPFYISAKLLPSHPCAAAAAQLCLRGREPWTRQAAQACGGWSYRQDSIQRLRGEKPLHLPTEER
jgi:hypothetical protein